MSPSPPNLAPPPTESSAQSPLALALLGRRRTALVRAVRKSLLAAQAVGARLTVACSGGADSTALLLALWALRGPLRLSLSVATVDHGLRTAAAAEVAAVARLAAELGLDCDPLTVTVAAGASPMAQARQARYRALATAATRRQATLLAVGHIRDDQSETLLLRLLGGAGLTGLAAMAPVAELPVVATPGGPLRLLRPLLAVSRQEVEAFLAPLLPLLAPLPVHDPSNRDPHYLRSRLRHEVLPTLRQLAPHLDGHLLSLTSQLRADAEYLDELAAAAIAQLRQRRQLAGDDGTVVLSAAALLALPLALRARVLRRLATVTLGQRHVEALLKLCERRNGQPGRQSLDLPGGLVARRDHDRLLLSHSSGRAAEPTLTPRGAC